MCLLDYSVNEAPDASDASETLGHFAVFRGCVHAPYARRVLMRFTSNCPLQCFFVSLALALLGAPLIASKPRTKRCVFGRTKKPLSTLAAFYKVRFPSAFITIPML